MERVVHHPQAGPRPAFADRLVLFFDFLGVSAAVSEWPPQRLAGLIGLLSAIDKLPDEGEILQSFGEDGTWKLTLRPDITSFSDNIVATFPLLEPLNSAAGPAMLQAMTIEIRKQVWRIASHALNLGLLIRGGLTLGPVYHRKRIILGAAMVEAVELERKERLPRVVISTRLASQQWPDTTGLLLKDSDGVVHLDYLRDLYEDPRTEERQAWVARIGAMIEKNVDTFRANEQSDLLKKWEWFEASFRSATDR